MKSPPWKSLLAAACAALPSLPLSGALSDPIAPADLVFAEVDGIVAAEAEHFISQTQTDVRAFYITSAEEAVGLTPDPDANHAFGASGGAYIEVLPDNRITHGEPLIGGVNFSNEPGKLAILTYRVKFSQPGRYYFWARHYSTGSEDNGFHVGLNGTWPESGQRWQTVKKRAWQWECRQRTAEVHVGVPMQLFIDIPSAGEHRIHISMREDGVELDKWVMATDVDYVPTGMGPEVQIAAGTPPPPFAPPAMEVAEGTVFPPYPDHWSEPPQIETMDYRPLPAGFGFGSGTRAAWIEENLQADAIREALGVALHAKDLFYEGTDFYLDQGKWAAIHPEKHQTASLKTTVPVGNTTYDVALYAVGENDGRSQYEVLMGGRSLGVYVVPDSSQMFEEGPAFVKVWRDVTINEGESLEVRAEVGTDGQEFARARWSKLVFTPKGEDPGKEAAMAAPAPATPTIESALFGERGTDGDASVTVHGDLKPWHKVTLDVMGPFAHELDLRPNPFTDYEMTVTFTHASGEPSYDVPGYFAADGDAGETGAQSGTTWRAHLSPDKPGTWNYAVSFHRGPNAATYHGGTPLAPYDGLSGSFTVAAAERNAPGFYGKGRLTYTGERYLRFAGDGTQFIKAGADAPETYLAYKEFDNTQARKGNVPLKDWGPHLQDWKEGDPTWHGGKGKGIIGSLNYLAGKGLNSFSFLTYNAGGDGDNIWPFVDRDDKFHYDVSKLDQWEIVFAHAQKLGLYLHFKLQENELDDHRAGARRNPKIIPEAMDAGENGPERRLYFREIIARFGHHLALNWNFGEENTQTYREQTDMFDYVAAVDPYNHHRVIHTFPQQQTAIYTSLLGDKSNLTGISAQNYWKQTHQWTHQWIEASAAAGRQWVVANDEVNPASYGVPADPGYEGQDGWAGNDDQEKYNLHHIRKYTLWGNLMAGGAGVEYYFGYKAPQNDLVCEDLRSRDRSWDYCSYALKFFWGLDTDLNTLASANHLVGNQPGENGNWCLANEDELYVIYLPEGGDVEIDLTSADGNYNLAWYNPRTGKARLSDTKVAGGAKVSLKSTDESHEDWAIVLRRIR